jgi:hypothetical protein
MVAFTLLLSLINFGVLWVLVAKVFFSTHQVEYRAIEELAKIRQDLGLDPSEDSDDINSAEPSPQMKSFVEQIEEEEDHQMDDFLESAKAWTRKEREIARKFEVLE